ncbi:hypothetical protein Tco_1005829 [Tanacetum coccineum]|uniref:Uncharacterized protein n=1 Tax=Tanacetum coccineum TaxID=301880 RepID=A0ABQ5FGG2_9ASTR
MIASRQIGWIHGPGGMRVRDVALGVLIEYEQKLHVASALRRSLPGNTCCRWGWATSVDVENCGLGLETGVRGKWVGDVLCGWSVSGWGRGGTLSSGVAWPTASVFGGGCVCGVFGVSPGKNKGVGAVLRVLAMLAEWWCWVVDSIGHLLHSELKMNIVKMVISFNFPLSDSMRDFLSQSQQLLICLNQRSGMGDCSVLSPGG